MFLPVRNRRMAGIAAVEADVAAIKPVSNKTALAALTTAALSLPGFDTQAAIPADRILGNASYGHYQESDERIQVDVYHADALIPLSDRLELSFSLDRDTYSGATPSFSMPLSMANQPKYKQKDDGSAASELSAVDLVSAASGGVTTGGLTILGGLNGFQSFSDGTARGQIELNTLVEKFDAETNAAQLAIDAAFNENKTLVTNTYQANLSSISPETAALTAQFNSDKAALEANIAAVPGTIERAVTIEFTGMQLGSYAGFANNAPIAGGNCAGVLFAGCFNESGMAIGTAQDTSNPIAHLHRNGDATAAALGYHADSSGIYIRALNSKAFTLNSMDFRAPITAANPGSGVNDYWEILGFNTALNPGLATGDGTNYANRVAYQTVPNGFNGNLTLNSTFQNISAFWIHYKGYPQTPVDGKTFGMEVDNILVTPVAAFVDLLNTYKTQLTTLTDTYNAKLLAASPAQVAALTASYNAQLSALTQNYTAQTAALTQGRDAQTAVFNTFAKQLAIDLYGDLLNSMVPTGTPTVQRFQLQPQETRTMPMFNVKYYFDATTLGVSGGWSEEPDFLSNFGFLNISHEFNDKLTTVSGGYGMTSNTITRNGAGHSSHTSHSEHSGGHSSPTDYAELNGESTFHNFNASISQILTKNTLFQSTVNYTHQSGYLTNPYKYVYVRGEITPEEYYDIWQNDKESFDWGSVTNLEVVGIELFREKRPNYRNIWSFSNMLNQYIPTLDATAHFDYRFYIDDWGINAHTFELKWYQSLPGGFTVTPSVRYYSQSQADFFAPYFLAPRADGNYSSDFRLSAFGDLSSGITVSKQFAPGIKLEAGFEYVIHAGDLKLGGGGIGDYADFDYYLAHANLSVDLSARSPSGSGHDSHSHHHHGAPVPAGVMFGHMMNKANDIMVGYRFMHNGQDGSMLSGSDPVSDSVLVSNACGGFKNGCLLKPTKMNMDMHMLDLMYAPTDWLNLMLMPQLMSMEMDMSEPIRPYADQTEENAIGGHAGATHTSDNLGDTVVTALVKVLDTDNHHVHLGLGASAPTGSINAKLNKDTFQDYGMQLGSGTWDFKPSLTYTGQLDDWGWGAQVSGVKRLEKNRYGYAYGDIFQATAWGSYQVFDWLSASVRGIYTNQGTISGKTNQTLENTASVDYPSNYGGRFWDVGFGLNAYVPEGRFAGHSVSFEWLQPVGTDFNGYQLDRNGALSVSWNFSF
jgi:Protein of unknown function (DUF3570)